MPTPGAFTASKMITGAVIDMSLRRRHRHRAANHGGEVHELPSSLTTIVTLRTPRHPALRLSLLRFRSDKPNVAVPLPRSTCHTFYEYWAEKHGVRRRLHGTSRLSNMPPSPEELIERPKLITRHLGNVFSIAVDQARSLTSRRHDLPAGLKAAAAIRDRQSF